ncbi:MAG: type I-C CRISPR-associated protein Cas8c/Csd1 [Betaproteobacteria bacterium]
MILQALVEYYDRKAADPDAALAAEGFEWKEIPFILELDSEGKLIQIADTRELQGKKAIAKRFLVPQAVKKTSGVAANLFWDTAEYVLGFDRKGKPERALAQRSAFAERIKSLEAVQEDAGVRAVLAFLANPESVNLLEAHFPAQYRELLEINPVLSFRMAGEVGLVCERRAVQAALRNDRDETSANGFCLVRGKDDSIERLHTAIKGVWGAQSSGANIVSFNLDAFNSFGKAQGANAPVGKQAAFAYSTALNHLLGRDSRQRIQVGDASTVFWSRDACALESDLLALLGETPKDDPDQGAQAVANLYAAIKNGVYAADDSSNRFYVLGLAPNAARISVRFFHSGPVREIAGNIKAHFDDLDIERARYDKSHLSIFRLLTSIAPQGKADSIPPNLAGDFARSILVASPYPATLLQAAVRRVRAEHEINYPRAALLKAVINRQTRSQQCNDKELNVSLDLSNNNAGYRLGRLFAVLERAQERANPGLNATIRDRYYGAASSTPVAVFSNLMKLKNHHIAKLENKGEAVNLEKLIGEVMDGVSDFPAHLALADQGRFAVGYYHQRQAFYNKSTSPE